MSQDQTPAQQTALAAIDQLSLTPSNQLPSVLPQVLNRLQSLRNSFPEASDSIIDKLKPLISSHLRSTESKKDTSKPRCWAAACLLSFILQSNSPSLLPPCKGWLTILSKVLNGRHDPVTKERTVLAISRIFLLAALHPDRGGRELPPSLLPQFAQGGVKLLEQARKLVSSSDPAAVGPILCRAQMKLASSLFTAFAELAWRFPTLFRPYYSALMDLTQVFMAPPLASSRDAKAASPLLTDDTLSRNAQHLYTQLHAAAPKKSGANGDTAAPAPTAWTQNLTSLVKQIESTADSVFRGVVERPTPFSGRRTPHRRDSAYAQDLQQEEGGPMPHLPPWHGMREGCERLAALLDALASYIRYSRVRDKLPVAAIIDLVVLRILSVSIPSDHPNPGTPRHHHHHQQPHNPPNPQIPTSERASLSLHLPTLQTHTLHVINALLALQPCLPLPWTNPLLSSLCTKPISPPLLSTASSLIDLLSGDPCSLPLPAIEELTSNLLPLLERLHADPASRRFVTTILCVVPSPLLPRRIRDALESHAVLTDDAAALLAGVVNPPRDGAGSVLPLLARAGPGGDEMVNLAVEATLRPRVPPTRSDETVVDDDGVESTDEETGYVNGGGDDERAGDGEDDSDGEGGANEALGTWQGGVGEVAAAGAGAVDDGEETGDRRARGGAPTHAGMGGEQGEPPREGPGGDLAMGEDEDLSETERGAVERESRQEEAAGPSGDAAQAASVAGATREVVRPQGSIMFDDSEGDGEDFEMPPLVFKSDDESDFEDGRDADA